MKTFLTIFYCRTWKHVNRLLICAISVLLCGKVHVAVQADIPQRTSFNVSAYGAIGDGLTDDTVAIEAAIEAAAISGGVVSFNPGTYKITASLRISAHNTHLRGPKMPGISSSSSEGAVLRFTGLGAGDTAIWAGVDPLCSEAWLYNFSVERLRIIVDPNVDVVLRVWRGANVTLRDLTIFGNNDSDGSTNRGVQIDEGVNCLFENINIYGSRGGESTISRPEHFLGQGFYLGDAIPGSPGTTTTLRRCYTHHLREGIVINRFGHVDLYDCISEMCTRYALSVRSPFHHSFVNCWFEGETSPLLYVTGVSPESSDAPHLYFSGCRLVLHNRSSMDFVHLMHGGLRFNDCAFSATESLYYRLLLIGNSDARGTFLGCEFPEGKLPATNRIAEIQTEVSEKLHPARLVTVYDESGLRIFGSDLYPIAVDFSVTPQLTGSHFTNSIATHAVTAGLPSATISRKYTFTRTASYAFRINPQEADSFRGHGAGKYLELDSDGGSATIECLTPGIWDIVAAYDPNGLAAPFAWEP